MSRGKDIGSGSAGLPNGISPEDVRLHLRTVLASRSFVNAERQRRFLSYVVEKTLLGETDRLKGYTIGVEVFDKPHDFDPTLDSSVRVEAGRLRAKLNEFYADSSQDETIRLSLPRGQYAVSVHAAGVGDEKAASVVSNAASKSAHKPVVVVLPFTNFSDDPEQDYFADGITDDLIMALSHLGSLDVIARHSSFRYKQIAADPRQIASELGADFLIEGSVRRAASRVRTNAQLIDAVTGTELWGQRFDREIGDIFEVQDEITRSVAMALELRFSDGGQAGRSRVGTHSVVAYEALLKGLYLFHGYTNITVAKALECFDQALDLDEEYVDAYVWRSRARAYIGIGRWGEEPMEDFRAALSDAKTAARLAPTEAFPLVSIAWSYLWMRDGEAAKAAIDRAYDVGRNSTLADVLHLMAMTYGGLGECERALPLCRQALRLNPAPPASYYFAMAAGYFAREEWGEVGAWCERGIAENPNFYPNFWLKLSALGLSEQASDAAALLANYQQVAPNVAPHDDSLYFVDGSCRDNLMRGLRLAGLIYETGSDPD